MAGDFNEWGSANMSAFTSLKLHTLNATASNNKPLRTFPARLPMVQLDYIYTRFLTPKDAQVPNGQGWARMLVKRTFDIVASASLLMLSLPVMIIAAIAVKLESHGPVIYRQSRVGLGGKPFDVLKFRSMRADAERDGTPQWAQRGDSRVTRVGHFMRLTRIDELPQLFSVLAGQMSLVGPRPERPYFVEQIAEKVPFYAARHSVKPGVTGWAQVRHHYGASVEDASDKLEYDLFYIKNFSLLRDLGIMLQTLRVVLWPEGVR